MWKTNLKYNTTHINTHINIYVNVNYLHTVDALNTVPIYVIHTRRNLYETENITKQIIKENLNTYIETWAVDMNTYRFI